MLPRSRFLDELRQGALPTGVEYHSVSAARDWVCPPSSTRLRGFQAYSVNLGHSSLILSAEVYKHVLKILRDPAEDVAETAPSDDQG
jgi:hypothetical protein